MDQIETLIGLAVVNLAASIAIIALLMLQGE